MRSRHAIAARVLLLCVLVSGGFGCAGQEAHPQRQEGKIVRVGDIVLNEEDLAHLLPEGERIPFTFEEKKQHVRRWVDTEILYHEAIRRGIKEDPRIRARLRSLEQEFLADHVTFLELRKRTMVTEAEIEEYFTVHEREYLYEYRVSHILVNTLEEAEEIKELLKTRSFIWVANRRSIDPVAKRGGDLGYLTKGNMIPEFESVIFDLEPGEVSEIVKSDFGYHIIKMIGSRESLVKVDLEDVREQIMNMLLIEKRERAYREFMNSLKTFTEIEYYDRAFAPGAPAEEIDSTMIVDGTDSVATTADSVWADTGEGR